MKSRFNNLRVIKNALLDLGYFCEIKNSGEKKLIKKFAKKKDIFIDVGFHIGQISETFYNNNKKATIYGFDVNKILNKKKKNDFKKKNIHIINKLLSDKNGDTNFYIYKDREELSSLAKRNDYNPSVAKKFKKIKCKTIKLDNFLANMNKDKKIFIKIDAEGAEKRILKGMTEVLKKFNISGYFEYGQGWLNFNTKLKEVFYFLKELNYDIYRINHKGLIHMRYFSIVDENYFNSIYFFSKENLNKYNFLKKKIPSLTSEIQDDIYLF